MFYSDQTNDSALNVIRTGNVRDPLIVLVHAIGLDLTYWDAQIKALEPRYDIIAYDLRGHGRSSAPATGYDFPMLRDDLASVITKTGKGAAHIIGLSVGGMIAQYLALSTPALVRSLSLIDTAATFLDTARVALSQRAQTTRFSGMGAILQSTLERWFTPEFATRRPDVLDRVSKTLLAADKDVHAAMWDTIATLDLVPRLNALRTPTLVLVGEKDPSTPIAAAQIIAEQIPNAQLFVLPNSSHMTPIEVPELVNDRLLAFVREAELQGGAGTAESAF
jgi:3-oxoadipate enol-lactonase